MILVGFKVDESLSYTTWSDAVWAFGDLLTECCHPFIFISTKFQLELVAIHFLTADLSRSLHLTCSMVTFIKRHSVFYLIFGKGSLGGLHWRGLLDNALECLLWRRGLFKASGKTPWQVKRMSNSVRDWTYKSLWRLENKNLGKIWDFIMVNRVNMALT